MASTSQVVRQDWERYGGFRFTKSNARVCVCVSPLSVPGMVVPHNLLQVMHVEGCIDIRSGNWFMSQHFLTSGQVSATFNKECSERMPERVRADLLFQSDTPSEIADNRTNH